METSTSSINIIPFRPPATLIARPAILSNRIRFPDKRMLWHATKVLLAIWETSAEGMRLTDDKGIIVAVNPSYGRFVSMKPEELVGNHFTCVYADVENREKMARAYEGRFTNRTAEPPRERTYILWTEQVLDVEMSSTFIESDDGRLLLLSRFRDIAAEKVTQKAVIESESKYRGLFANSILPMFQSTVNGKLTNANRAMLKLLGYNSFYELAELDIALDIYSDSEERKLVTETLHQKGYVVNIELKLKRKNGKIITVLENARTLVDDSGNVIGYEGILEDITARKAMEKKLQEYVWALEKSKNTLSELNAQKDKLFSILSHDLRSPFSSILGFCDILLRENDQLTSEDRLQFVAYIQESAQDQLTLVNKLLDWSRLESGQIRMEQTDVDLQDIVNKNIRSLLGLAHQKQVKLEMKLPANVIVRGDRQMLNQVFGNLIGNALKFTPPQGSISIELIEERDNQWVIGVRDTGIGIPEEDLHKLFKLEEKYTRKGLQGEKGTGLGLLVVHEIIQKHHGTIEVKSTIGRGTLFFITLPKRRLVKGHNILVVDDDHGMRALHSRYIKRVLPDANVLHAADGREAFQLAQEFNPKVIISDNDMPDLDGVELVRNLKADSATCDIPIIIVTGHDSDANREALKKYGVTEILNKPISPEHLAEVLVKIEAGDVPSVVQD